MAVLTPIRPAFITGNYKLYPASYYSRPAMSPLPVAGLIGYTQQNLLDQYKYTLQQMAVSPFSVNDKDYIQRIRETYGIYKDGTYDLYGNIGGFLGVAGASALSLGLINSPKTWKSAGVFSDGINPHILATRKARTVSLSKKNPTKYLYNLAFQKNKELVIKYNSSVDWLAKMTDAAKGADAALDVARTTKASADAALEAAEAAYKANKFRYISNLDPKKITALQELADLRKAASTAADELTQATKAIDASTEAVELAAKNMDTALVTLKGAKGVDGALDAVELGTKATAKAGGFVPIIGIGMDVVSLGISGAAFIDSMNNGDVTGMWLNGISTFLDAVALVADFFPGIGDAISIGASVASAGVSGWYTGQTIGHSLSAEGLQAQANFFKNLQQSILTRPISAVGNLATLWGVSKLSSLGRKKQSKWFNFFNGTGWGNFARSTVSMTAMRMVNAGTSWVEDQIGLAPTDPSQVNFTNGIGVWGDINDNLFGATLRKTQLASLVDTQKEISFGDLYEQSWGITDKKDQIYNSIMFSQVREAAGIDFKKAPILNSVIDIVGEVFVDPENYAEAYQRSVQSTLVDNSVEFLDATFTRAEEIVRLKQAVLTEKDPNAKLVIDKNLIEEFLVGPDGILKGNSQARKRFLKQAVEAWAADGEKGLRSVLADVTATRYQGDYGKDIEVLRGEADANVDIMVKLFTDVFVKGDFTSLRYTNADEVAGYKAQLQTMQDIVDSIAKDKDLTPSQEALRKESVATFTRLRDYYGVESTNILVEKFMTDLGKDFTPHEVRALYATDADIRFHMDLVDEFSSLTTWAVMPIQKIARIDAIRKYFKTLNNFGRRFFAAKAQSAKTILKAYEVFDDYDKNFKQDDIKKLIDEKEAELKKRQSIDEMLTYKNPELQDLIDSEAQGLSHQTEKAADDYAETVKVIKEHEAFIKQEEEAIKKDESYTYVPTTTHFNGRKNQVYIKDDADARAKLHEADEYERTVIEPTGLSINQFARRNRDSLAYQEYQAKKIAAADYLMHVKYKTLFDGVTTYANYSRSLISHITSYLYKGTAELWATLGYFRTYQNTTKSRFEFTTKEKTRVEKRVISLTDKIKAQDKIVINTKEALDKIDNEIKDLEAKLKDKAIGGTSTHDVLSERLAAAKKERIVAYTADVNAKNTQVSLNESLTKAQTTLEAYERQIAMMNNYIKARKAVEDSGRKWLDSDFDKETMIYPETPIASAFSQVKWEQETEMLSEIQTILARSGIDIYYTDEKGHSQKLIVNSKLMPIPKGASLQVKFDLTLEDAFYGTLVDLLTTRNASVVLANTFEPLKTLKGERLQPDVWRKLGPKEQTAVVVEMIQRLNLTDTEKQSLNQETIRRIVTNLNDAALKDTTRTIQIEHLDNIDDIRALVVSNLKRSNAFKTQYEKIFSSLRSMQEKFDKIRQDITDAKDTSPEEKAEQQLLLNYYIDDFNNSFKRTEAYKYLKSNIYKHEDKRTHLRLFQDDTILEGNTLPDFQSIKYLTDMPATKIDTLEQGLTEYVASGAVQETIKFAEDSIQHAKNVSMSEALAKRQGNQEEDILKKESDVAALELAGAPEAQVNAAREQLKVAQENLIKTAAELEVLNKQIISYRASVIERTKEEEAQQAKDDVVLNKVATALEKLVGKKNLKNARGVEIVNNHTKRTPENAEAVREAFAETPTYRDHSETHVVINPTRYFESLTSSTSKDYFRLLDERDRRSPEHQRMLRLFAEYLYDKVVSSKKTLRVVNLAAAPKITGVKLSPKEAFVQQVITTYKTKKGIEVVYKNQSSYVKYNSTSLLRLVVKEELSKYLEANKERDDIQDLIAPYIDIMSNITDDGLIKLSEKISRVKTDDESDEAVLLKQIRSTVWEAASQRFEDIKVRNSYGLGDILKHADRLHDFERTDMESLSEGHYVVSYDVVSQLVYRNPKMAKLLNNIIKYNVDSDDDISDDTPLFALIKLVDKSLSEDYRDKEAFIPSDYTNIKVTDGIPYLEKKDGSFTSLFNIIYVQHVNILHVRNLLNSIKTLTPELRAEFEQAYMKMVNENKGILSYQPNNITKEVYLATKGNTEEEWNFIENNAGVASVYNMLALDTSLKKLHKSDVDPYRLKHYLNRPVRETYQLSLKTEDALKTLQDRGIILKKEDLNTRHLQEILFGMLVLSSKDISTTRKKYIVNDLMFYNASRTVVYTKHAIENANAEIKKLKKELERAGTAEQAIIENQLLTYQNFIKYAEDVRTHLQHDSWGDPETRYDMLVKDPTQLNHVYGFFRDTDGDDNEYVMARVYNEAHTSYTYVPIRKMNKSGKPNADIVVRGSATINLPVLTNLQNPAGSKLQEAVMEKIKASVLWQKYYYTGSGIKAIKIGANGSIVLITSTIKDSSGDYDITNSDLHKRIKDAREALVQEIATTDGVTFNSLYTMSEKEYDTLLDGKSPKDIKREDLDTEPIYVARLDKEGRVIGEQPPLVNTSAIKSVMPALFKDLERWSGLITKNATAGKFDSKIKAFDKDTVYTEEDLADALIKYAKLNDTKIIPNQAFFSKTTLSSSETMRRFKQTAESLQAYGSFINYLEAEGLPITDINLQRIVNAFFKHTFIKNNADGTRFNLDKLQDMVQKDLYEELSSKSYRGLSYLDRIKNALVKMQEEYGDKNIDIRAMNELPKEFIDTLDSLNTAAIRALQSVGQYGKNLQNKISSIISKHYDSGTPYGADTQEIRNVNMLSERYLTEAGVRPKIINKGDADYDSEENQKNIRSLQEGDGIWNPAHNNRAGFKRDILKLREYFRLGGQEHLEIGLALHKKHSKQRADMRTKLARQERARLNYNVYKQYTDNLSLYDNNLGDMKVEIDYKDLSHIYEAATKLRPRIIEIFDKYEGKSLADYARGSKEYVEIAYLLQLFRKAGNTVIDNRNINIDQFETVEATTRFLINTLTNDYIENVYSAMPVPERDIIQQYMFSGITDVAKATEEINAQLEANKKKFKDAQRLSDAFRMYSKRTNVEQSIDTLYNTTVTKLLGETIVDLSDDFMKVIDRVEQHVYPSNKTEVVKAEELTKITLKSVIQKYYEDNIVTRSTADILNNLLETEGETAKELVQYVVIPFISKRSIDMERLSDKAKKRLEEGIEYDDAFIKELYTARRRSKTKPTEFNASMIWDSLNLPILQKDNDFYQYLLTRHFSGDTKVQPDVLKDSLTALGIKDANMLKVIYAARNMEEVRRILGATDGLQGKRQLSGHVLSNEDLYVFIEAVNVAKRKYLMEKHNELHPEPERTFNWLDAYLDHGRLKVREAQRDIKDLMHMGAFTGNYDSNIIRAVRNESAFIFDALAFKKRTDNDLKHIMVPESEKTFEEDTLKDLPIRQSESQFLTESRKSQREMYSVFFVPEKSTSPAGEQYYQLRKDLNVSVIDMAAEQFADSWDTVGNVSVAYNGLRGVFNRVLYALYGGKVAARDFIKLPEAAGILVYLKETKQTVHWANLYEVLKERAEKVPGETKYNAEDLTKAFDEAEKFFKEHSSIETLDEITIKAIVAYAINSRLSKEDPLRLSNKQLFKFAEQQNLAKHRQFMRRIENLSYRLNAAKNEDEVAMLIFGKTVAELEQDQSDNAKETVALFKAARKINDLLKSGYKLTPENLIDMYVESLPADVELRDAETSEVVTFQHAAMNYKVHNDRLSTIQGKVKAFQRKADDTNKSFDDVLEVNLQDAIKEYETATHQDELVKDQLIVENAIVQRERMDIYQRVLINHPELLRQYILTKEEAHKKRVTAREEILEDINKHIRQEVLKRLETRLVRLDEISKEFETARQRLYVQINKMSAEEATAHIEQSYAWLLTRDNVTPEQLIQQVTTHNQELNDEKARLNSDMKDSAGKIIFTAKQVSRYINKVYKNKVNPAAIEAIKEFELTPEEIMADDKQVEAIAAGFFKDVRLMHLNSTKAEFNKVLTEGKTIRFDKTTKANLEKILKERIEGLTKRIDKVEKDYTPLNDLAPYSRWYKGQAAIKLNKLEDLRKQLKSAEDTLAVVQTNTVHTFKEILDDSLKAYLDKKHLTFENSAEDILDFMTGGTNLYTNLNTLKEQQKEIEARVKTTQNKVEDAKNDKDILKTLADARALNTQLKRQQTIAERHMNEAHAYRQEQHPYTNSNLGTYKNLHRDRYPVPATQREKDLQDRQVLRDVINDTIATSNLTRSDIAKLAKAMGKETIHNSFIDTLITRLNFMARHGKTKDDDFYVFDMETIQHNGQEIPYQITTIHNIGGKMIVQNAYFNSIAFNRDGNEDTETTAAFKERMFDMKAKEFKDSRTLDPEAPYILKESDIKELHKVADKEVEDLISKLHYFKNDSAFLKAYVTMFEDIKQNNLPLVTHNGKKFDLPNFENFVARYANTLLSNFYYSSIYQNNPDAILARYESQGINALADLDNLGDAEVTTEILNAFKEEHAKILAKLNDPAKRYHVTLAELKQLDTFNEAIYRAEIAKNVRQAEENLHIFINNDVRKRLFDSKTGQVTDIRNKVTRWLSASPEEQKQIREELITYYAKGIALSPQHDPSHNYMPELETKIDKMLGDFKDIYEQHRNKNVAINYTDGVYKSRRRQVIDKLMEKVGHVDTSEPYPVQAYIESQQNQIRQLQETRDILESGNPDVLAKGVDSLYTEQQELDTKMEDISTRLTKLEELINNKSIEAVGYLSRMNVFLKDLQGHYTRQFQQALRIQAEVNIRLADTKRNNQLAITNEVGYKYQLNEVLKDIQGTVNKLSNIVKTLGDEYVKLQESDEFIKIQGTAEYDDKLASAFSNRTKELGYSKEEWYDFKSKAELDTYKKQLQEEQKRYRALEEDFRHEKYSELKNKSYFDEQIKKFREQHQEDLRLLIQKTEDASVTALAPWAKDVMVPVFNSASITSNYKETQAYLKEFSASLKKFLEDNHINEKTIREHTTLQQLLRLTDGNKGMLIEAVSAAYVLNSQVAQVYEDTHKAIADGLNQSAMNTERLLKGLDNVVIGDTVSNSLLAANEQVKQLLTRIGQGTDFIEDMTNLNTLNIVGNRGPSSQELERLGRFNEVASSHLDKDAINALGDEYVWTTRLYDRATKNDIKEALMLKKDKVYYRPVISPDGSLMFIIGFHDQLNEHTQTIILDGSLNPRFNLSYNYRYANKPLDKIQRVNLKIDKGTTIEDLGYGVQNYEQLDVRDNLDNFYKKHVPSIAAANVYQPEGTDTSFEAIKAAMIFYDKYLKGLSWESVYKNKKDLTTKQRAELLSEAMNNIFKKAEAVNTNNLHLRDLDVINMTKRTENMFVEYVKTARLLAGARSFKDSAGVYRGLADRLLSRFNSRVPGKLLNLIDSEFVTNQLIDYDDDALAEKGIDIANSPEGGMGATFARRTGYSTHTPFAHNTNPIRIALPTPKQQADFTAIGIINILWKAEDDNQDILTTKNYNNNIAKLFDKLLPQGDDYVVFLRDKTLSTVSASKPEDRIMTFTPGVIETLRSVGLGTDHNIFTPDVVSKEDYDRYQADVLHKIGLNLSVTLTNDARAFEDVPLMDYDIAMALGWNKGYKTWLGRSYGFKGGVYLVHGLYKQYGTAIVANADSVIKRGSYGMLVDMVIHKVGSAIVNKDKLSEDEKKQYKLFLDSYAKENGVLHKYLTITDDDKFLVKPNTDYTNFFDEKELFGHLTASDVQTRIDSLLKVSLDNVEDYKTRRVNDLVNVSSKDRWGWQGKIYVTLDSEHITENMANNSQVRNFGGIDVATVDESGTVLNGAVLSISVLYPMLAKSLGNDMNWIKAFYNEDTPQDVILHNKRVKLYTDLAYSGVEGIFKEYGVKDSDGKYDIRRTVANIKLANVNKNIQDALDEYLLYQSWESRGIKEDNESLKEDAQFRMAELNKRIRQEAHDKLVGKNGILNSALFRKHAGGRQQLVANTELKLGRVVTNQKIWTNSSKTTDWVQYEAYDTSELREDLFDYTLENGKKYTWTETPDNYQVTVSNDEAQTMQVRLNSLGIFSTKNKDAGVKHDMLTVEHTDTDTTFTINKVDINSDGAPVFARAYGWMLSMRSPVQDYNAVPLMKVIGYHDHQALEANKYLYGMIGGDNDGDTLGMILIDKHQYEYLKALDATKEEYYDEGYFDNVDKDYLNYDKKTKRFIYDDTDNRSIKTKQTNKLNGIAITYSPVGKKTFGNYRNNTKEDVAIRNTYTLDELYINTFKSLNITKEKIAAKLKELYPDTFEEVMKNESLMRIYANVLVRNRTHGYDNFTDGRITKLTEPEKAFETNQGYADIEAIKTYLTDNKDEVALRYALNKGLKENNIAVFGLITLGDNDVYSILPFLDKEDQDYLQKTFHLFDDANEKNTKATIKRFLESNDAIDVRIRKEITTRKVLNRLMQNTVTRVQGAKIGIEVLGGNRKIQFISSLILRLAAVNRDATGGFLESIGAYGTNEDGITAMTPVSLAKALFEGSSLNIITEQMKAGTYVLPKDEDTFYNSLSKKKIFKKITVRSRSGEKLSLAAALQLIDPKMSNEQAEAAAEETYKAVAGMLYDAYKTKQRTTKVFEALADALMNPILTKGLKEFFDTCYSTAEEINSLYPIVNTFRERLIADDKYKPEAWELEWLKIQLFGAQQKEADAFFRLAKNTTKSDIDKLNNKVASYADGYLNEHIIGRKELNIISDKATTIIALAKHFGSDINTSEWLRTYIEGLVEEVNKHNVRLTNLDPKRQYLSLAIAMDRNPFESYDDYKEIQDAAYSEALTKRQQKHIDRAVLQKNYNSTAAAAQNLQEITEDNFSVQLLGRLGAHERIISEVKNTLLKFLQAFDNDAYDISSDSGLKRAALAANDAAEELLLYGITGYRIRNFVDDYMFNLNYINTTLVQNNLSPIPLTQKDRLIKAAARFMEVMYKVNTRATRTAYDALLRTDATFTNAVIQDEARIDTYYYAYDEDGNLVRRTDNNESGIDTNSRDYAQEELSAIGMHGEYAFKKAKETPNAPHILKVFLDNAKMNLTDKYYSLDEVRQHVLDEYYALRSVFVNIDKQREDSRGRTTGALTPDEMRRNALWRQLYNKDIIESDINSLATSKNKYALALQEKRRLESDMRTLQKQKEHLAARSEVVVKQHAAMKDMADVAEQIRDIDAQIKERQERITKAEEQITTFAFNKTFSDLTGFVHSDDDDAYTIRNLYSYDKPRLITDETIDKMRNNVLMNMHQQMSPFLITARMFVHNGEFNAKEMYDWMVSRYDHVRLNVIRRGDEDEGLLKRLFNTLFVKVDDKKHNRVKLERAFKSEKELEDHINAIVNAQEEQTPLHFNKQDFDGIDTNITIKKAVTPTLKEIDVDSPKVLEYIYGIMQDPEQADQAKALIGFVNMDDMMDAYDMAYIPYQQTDWGAGVLQKMYSLSKLMQRLSTGFLLRNWIDTWNQLYSEAQQKYGVIGAIFKAPDVLRIMRDTSEMKHVYQRISLDRTLYLTAYKAEYQEMSNILRDNATLTKEQQQTVMNHLDNIIRVAVSYQTAKLDDVDNLTNSINTKQLRAKELIESLKRIQRNAEKNIDTLRSTTNISVIERSMALVGSMKFAEYFSLYDKLADVFDDTGMYQSNNRHYVERLRKRYSNQWSTFKQDLFEITAFMQTNAQLDIYQKDQASIIKNVLDEMLTPDNQPTQNYQVFKDAIDKELKNETTTFLKAFGRSASGLVPSKKSFLKLRAAYDWLTADTENSGRMVGYMLDKYLHNLTFEQSVDKSMTRFFNYGQRSPLEKNYLADFPYLSFPIRSINNWIHRIADPRYIRLLSDMLDGIYGQFADEDGQFDSYTRYQMSQGWIPIAGGIGVRMGNGAFDVMQLLTDPSGQIAQRKSPLGRMIATVGDYLVSEERDSQALLGDVIKQSAVVGFAARGINHITAAAPETRDQLANMPVVNRIVNTKQSDNLVQGIARSSSMLFWYEDPSKYTPKKYQYNQGNGRYKYYENIYKDWFNKYGRMRVPKVDPYSLVKEIQWHNYLRARQHRY